MRFLHNAYLRSHKDSLCAEGIHTGILFYFIFFTLLPCVSSLDSILVFAKAELNLTRLLSL